MFQITLQANLIDLKRWLNMLLERTAQKETWQSTIKIIKRSNISNLRQEGQQRLRPEKGWLRGELCCKDQWSHSPSGERESVVINMLYQVHSHPYIHVYCIAGDLWRPHIGKDNLLGWIPAQSPYWGSTWSFDLYLFFTALDNCIMITLYLKKEESMTNRIDKDW